MRSSIISAAAFLTVCVSALKVTSPTKTDVVDLSGGVKVTWESVSSDPKTAHLFLVNQAGGHAQYSKDLGEIDISSGSQTVTVKDVPNDTAYQFNIQSVTQLNTGILAQSEQFEVKADKKSTTSTTKSASSTASSGSESVTDAPSSSSDSSASSTVSSASTLITLPPSSTGASNGTNSQATRTSSSSAGAATAMAVQGGSLLALAIGLVAVIA
ncbi:hypothetical protein B0H63DRAFT_254922 [Podospora didyma]|uniref:Yeast cell wall synthesis Kre9/Knh1-like N-terminal domain-containing protein n=1 Tax=Podospora didyma TaxID=330526 RepID=A0AAE0KDP1_9PEZI|nr:hypothetical protein B0H63DRAFT_254922 [Podospora didyma]